jgi:hypothetical protein
LQSLEEKVVYRHEGLLGEPGASLVNMGGKSFGRNVEKAIKD